MPGYSWKKAKELLTETEKDRICCLILTCADQIKPSSAEFAVAAAEFGAAPGGFTKMYQTTIKKLKDNNAFAGGEDGEGVATAADGDAETSTPTKPKATPRKRKAKSPSGDADAEATPKKKGRMTKKAKAEAEAAAAAQTAEPAANGAVKEEATEEDAGTGAVKDETVET